MSGVVTVLDAGLMTPPCSRATFRQDAFGISPPSLPNLLFLSPSMAFYSYLSFSCRLLLHAGVLGAKDDTEGGVC